MEIIELFLGELSVSEWVFCIFLMWMGILLYVFIRLKNRKNRNMKLSISYWFKQLNNIIALVIAVILTYVLIRFYSEYKNALLGIMPQGFEMTPYFTMLVLGFGQHKISEWLSKRAVKKTE